MSCYSKYTRDEKIIVARIHYLQARLIKMRKQIEAAKIEINELIDSLGDKYAGRREKV